MTGTWSEYREDKWYDRWGSAPRQIFDEVTLLHQRFNMVLGGAVRTNLGPAIQERLNLTAELELAQLTEDVKSLACSEKHLSEVLQSPEGKRFGREIVNAGSRERFFADGEQLNQLEFFLGFENAPPTYIVEGNLQLIERLLKLSTPDVRLGTEVQKVERLADERFTLTSLPTGGGTLITEEYDHFRT